MVCCLDVSTMWHIMDGRLFGCMWIFAARIRRMGKVIVSVCQSTPRGEGVPHLHPIILPLVHVLSGGYPSDWYQVPSGGTPGWDNPLARDGVPPGQGWGTPPPQDRTADGILDTQRVVCLLHSRRRTFFLPFSFWPFHEILSCIFKPVSGEQPRMITISWIRHCFSH